MSRAKGGFRTELKWQISLPEWYVLRSRLRRVMDPDPHGGPDGSYEVRSLYFDDLHDSAVHEKLEGLDDRKKVRLRIYDGSDAVIKLEKKTRHGDLTAKEAVALTRDEVRVVTATARPTLGRSEAALLRELKLDMRLRLSRPVTMFDYRREAFHLPVHDLRITCDRGLFLCLGTSDIFARPETRLPLMPDARAILEVKYTRYVPSHISGILMAAPRERVAYSKYVVCRMAGYRHHRGIAETGGV